MHINLYMKVCNYTAVIIISYSFALCYYIDIINCSTPSAGDGVIINPYSNTTEGASISFTCGPGQEEIIAICSSNGSWTPNPADRICTNPPESTGIKVCWVY